MTQHDGDTIRKASGRCLHLFAQNIEDANSLDGTGGLTQSTTLQDEFARFKLWESNIGVFADVHASLDFRLREIPDIAELFLRQLDAVQERLHQVSQLGSHVRVGNDPEGSYHERSLQCPECGQMFTLLSDTRIHLEDVHSVHNTGHHKDPAHEVDIENHFSNWSTPDLLQSIHDSIDWLHRLSNMVRKASFKHHNRRADDFMLRDENGKKSEELTRSLLEGLEKLYRFYIQKYTAGVGEQLAQRLIQTMIIRHKRVLYRRAKKPIRNLGNTHGEIRQKSGHFSPTSFAPETTTPTDRATPGIPQPTAQSEMIPPDATSRLTATTVDISIIRKTLPKSEISKATSNSLHLSVRVLVPPRPRGAELGTEFSCDYCGLVLQAREASNERVWANHVRKDLDPYICVFDECDTPFETYSSRKEWLAHMRSRHRMRWHCFATTHEHSFFESPEALEEHLRMTHTGHFSEEEISVLVENGGHSIRPVIEHCPFCQENAEDAEEHVAQHLTQFALRSLPWPEDGYSSGHASQSSLSGCSESAISSFQTRLTDRGEDEMSDIRKTDWDAWELEIQAEDNSLNSVRNQWHNEPILTDEGNDLVGLHVFMPSDYDAANDELLEPFRQRANLGAVSSANHYLAGRQTTLTNFIHEEAIFVKTLNLLAKTYYLEAARLPNVPEQDQASLDLLLSNVNNLLALHEGFLNELERAVFLERGETPSPVPGANMVSSLNTLSAESQSLGTVVLKNFRKLGPAHEACSAAHNGALRIRQTLMSHQLHQGWVRKRNRLGQKQTFGDPNHRQFNDLMQYVNGRWYQSEHYATWVDSLSAQTPSDHPDKNSLLVAAAYHRDSVTHDKSVMRTDDTGIGDESVEDVLTQGYQGGSLFGTPFGEQIWTDIDLSDADLTELCGKFHDDQSRLSVTCQELEDYCERVKHFCGCLKSFASEIEQYKKTPSNTAYSFVRIQLVRLSTTSSYSHWSVDLDAIRKAFIDRISKKLLGPLHDLMSMRSRAVSLIYNWESLRADYETYRVLGGNGKDYKDFPRSNEESKATASVLREELPILHHRVSKFMAYFTERLILEQVRWFSACRSVFIRLAARADTPEWADIISDFHRAFGSMEANIKKLRITMSSHSSSSNVVARSTPMTLRPKSMSSSPIQDLQRDDKDALESSETVNASQRMCSEAVTDNEDGSGTLEPKEDVLWSAASLYEFDINTSEQEAGYPYLHYQVGEIFDVLAENGELWLAVNQDDPNKPVGWIWSKHFAKLQSARQHWQATNS